MRIVKSSVKPSDKFILTLLLSSFSHLTECILPLSIISPSNISYFNEKGKERERERKRSSRILQTMRRDMSLVWRELSLLFFDYLKKYGKINYDVGWLREIDLSLFFFTKIHLFLLLVFFEIGMKRKGKTFS